MTATIDNYIFNPFVTTKQSVEKYLKETYENGENNNVRYIHPYSKYEQCCYDKTTKKLSWITLKNPIIPSSLLAQNDYRKNEDSILARIETYGLDILKLRNKNITIQPIPDGQEVIECSLNIMDESFPLLFVISEIYQGNYFDLVIHEYNSIVDRQHHPLYFYKKSQCENGFPFKHSGDMRTGDNLIQYLNKYSDCKMRQMNTDFHNSNDYNSGIITAHAYNKKSFLDIIQCNPSICIVDYINNDSVNIYLKQFPLSEDFVNDNSICHLAKFTYIADKKKVIWTIPHQPEFDNIKINVGGSNLCYDSGILKFKEKIYMINQAKELLHNETITLRERTIASTSTMDDIDEERCNTLNEENFNILIIQKPLLKSEKFGNLYNDILDNNNNNNNNYTINTKNIYTFQTSISSINDCDSNDDNDDDNDYAFTLPIAGGSVLHNGSLIKLGKPIKKQTAINFKRDLNNSNNRPIVILCDQSPSTNIPQVKSKLNAVYILINFNEDCNTKNKTVEEKLNDINASLPISMQGGLSTIFVYFPSNHNFYYYRGIINDYNNNKLKFGHRVTLSDILSEASTFLLSPLVVPSSSSVVPIYSIGGQQELFCIERGDRVSNILDKINNLLRGRINNTFDEIVYNLKYILAQLEVNISSKELEDMIAIVAENLNKMNQMTKIQCLQLIIKNRENIFRCPSLRQIEQFISLLSKEDMNSYYNTYWLLESMAKILDITDRSVLFQKYSKMFQDITNIIKKFSSCSIYQNSLFELLNTCVSMRSSYGFRKRGLTQIIRQKKVNKNLESINNMKDYEMEEFLEKNCTNDGVILLKINKNKLLSFEEEEEEETYRRQTYNWSNDDDDDYSNDDDDDDDDNDDDNSNLSIINRREKTDFELQEMGEKIKKLTTRLPNFDRVDKHMAPYLLKDNVFNRLNFEWENKDFLIIPMLEPLIDIMKEPHKYPWRDVKEGGSIEFARMMLRGSIYNLIPENKRIKYNIVNAGSEKITEILINILLSGIYTMADNRIDFSSSNENDGLIKQFRCLMGYVLSIMASGVNKPASLVYQTILYNNIVSSNKIDLGKDNENLWLHQLLNLWPYLKLDVNFVQTNTMKCIYNRLKDCCNAILYNKKNTDDGPNEKEQELLEKALWSYNFLRPVVVNILKRKIKDIEKEEEKIEKEFVNRVRIEKICQSPQKKMKKDNKEKLTKDEVLKEQRKKKQERELMRQSQPRIYNSYFDEINDDDDDNHFKNINYIEENIRAILNTNQFYITKNNTKSRTVVKSINNFYYNNDEDYDNILQEIKSILHMYKEMRPKYTDKMNNTCYLFNVLEEIDKKIHSSNNHSNSRTIIDNISSLLNKIYSSALDIYLNRSTIILHLVIKLYNSIITYPSKSSILDINNIKYSILSKVLKFKTPLYIYTNIPKFIGKLIDCTTIEQYQSSEFKFELVNFIQNKRILGHFMRGYILQHDDVTLREERDKINKQIQKLQIEINKDKKLLRMFNYLQENNYMGTKLQLLNKLVEIA